MDIKFLKTDVGYTWYGNKSNEEVWQEINISDYLVPSPASRL